MITDITNRVAWYYRMFWATIALATMVTAQVPEILPRDADTHKNPGCSITGSKTAVRCSCVRMVSQVETFFNKRCWTDFGWKEAAGPDERQTYWIKGTSEFTDAENPPEDVAGCLAKVPDHCRVVAKIQGAWEAEGVDLDEADGCGTACRPELCFCNDGGCKSHEQSDVY